MQKKDAHDDVMNKYLQKTNYQRRKLLIPPEEAIENYKAFKKLYTNGNNGLTVIEISPEENIQDSEITQGENKEVIKYNKINKCRLKKEDMNVSFSVWRIIW